MLNLEFEEQLREILNKYNQGSNEPLDGDEVDTLVEHLKNQLNLMQGNITSEEYFEIYSK